MNRLRPFALLLPLCWISACATVPLTGRSQLNLIPSATMLSMSSQQYGAFLKENPPSPDTEKARMVQRVGRNIQGAVERYFAENGLSDRLEGYSWEFNLVEGKEANAWCMPGGKVVVYTGILPYTRDETGLAVVMGHEIAHAVAEHGNERMTQALAVQMGGLALSTAMAQQPDQTRQLWMAAFGVGSQLGFLLPYSRLHESEADQLGLIFMAMAGYDPRQAPAFWERMAAKEGKAAVPELLSTHPSDERRIREIQAHLPKALPYYERGRKGTP